MAASEVTKSMFPPFTIGKNTALSITPDKCRLIILFSALQTPTSAKSTRILNKSFLFVGVFGELSCSVAFSFFCVQKARAKENTEENKKEMTKNIASSFLWEDD